MINRIFTFESTRVRQRAAPLLEEREAFLSHLYNLSTPIDQLRSIASTLILIVRFELRFSAFESFSNDKWEEQVFRTGERLVR
jgi:hypothetical protein